MIFYLVLLIGIVEPRTTTRLSEGAISELSEGSIRLSEGVAISEGSALSEGFVRISKGPKVSNLEDRNDNFESDDSASFFAPVNQFDNFKGLVDGVVDPLTNFFEEEEINDFEIKEGDKDGSLTVEEDQESWFQKVRGVGQSMINYGAAFLPSFEGLTHYW